MPKRHPFLWLFLVSAPVAGLVYWWQTDWWIVWPAPTKEPGNFKPGFFAPGWWQAGESAAVGVAVGAALAGAARLLCRVWPRGGKGKGEGR
jgi:hypothetical protein